MDNKNLKWFSLDELQELTISHAAHYVLEHWVREGQFQSKVYGGVAHGDRMVIIEMPEF